MLALLERNIDINFREDDRLNRDVSAINAHICIKNTLLFVFKPF